MYFIWQLPFSTGVINDKILHVPTYCLQFASFFYSVCTRYNECDKSPFAKCKRSIKAYVLWCWLFENCMWIALKGF